MQSIDIFCPAWGAQFRNFFCLNTFPSLQGTIRSLEKKNKLKVFLGIKTTSDIRFLKQRLKYKNIFFIKSTNLHLNNHDYASELLRNHINKTKSDYILLIGADGIYSPKLGLLIKKALQQKIDIIFSMAVKILGKRSQKISWEQNLIENIHPEWKALNYKEKTLPNSIHYASLFYNENRLVNGKIFCPHPLLLRIKNNKLKSIFETWENSPIDHFLSGKNLKDFKILCADCPDYKTFSVDWRKKNAQQTNRMKKISSIFGLLNYLESQESLYKNCLKKFQYTFFFSSNSKEAPAELIQFNEFCKTFVELNYRIGPKTLKRFLRIFDPFKYKVYLLDKKILVQKIKKIACQVTGKMKSLIKISRIFRFSILRKIYFLRNISN